MTDRELLEAAAKAAGMRIQATNDGRYSIPVLSDGMIFWNPLKDDGDALRLAVKLGIGVRPHLPTHWQSPNTTVALFDLPDERAGRVSVPHAADPFAATRRAIVRAAAAMVEHAVLGAA